MPTYLFLSARFGSHRLVLDSSGRWTGENSGPSITIVVDPD